MRYSPSEYVAVDGLALQIRLDYGFTDYYLDIFMLAQMLGINLVPYSKLSSEQLSYVNSFSALGDAFSTFRIQDKSVKFYTFYNDRVTYSRQRFSIGHEVKHVVLLENNPTEKDEDLANHFARYILAPTCLVMNYVDKEPREVAAIFKISVEAAKNALKSAKNRINYRGVKLSKIESKFVELVDKKK